MAELSIRDKEIQDEVAVRVDSQVYVWDGQQAVFLDSQDFLEHKKEGKIEFESKDMDGAVIAVPMGLAADVDWSALQQQREEDVKAIRVYYEGVVRLRKEEDKVYNRALLMYWDRGNFVNNLLAKPKKYGNKTVEQFAADVDASPSSIYKCKECAQTYTRERVIELSGRKMTWRDTVKLLSVKSVDERTKLEDSLLAGDIDTDDLSDAVKKLNRADKDQRAQAGEKVDRRGGASLKTTFNSTQQMSEKLQEKLSDFREAFKACNKLPKEKQKPETLKSMKATMASLLRLHRLLAKMAGTSDKPK